MQPKKSVKQKTCKVCGEKFTPYTSLSRTCSPKCALEDGRKQAEKKLLEERRAYKRETRRRKEAMKTRSDWMKEVQKEFNAFIRARDHGQPCISCGRDTGAKKNAGHYMSVGGFPELRFNEINCHLQCEHCNTYLSGNLTQYRERLVEKIGLPLVEWLEGPHKALKPTVEELKYLKKYYVQRTKEAKRWREH